MPDHAVPIPILAKEREAIWLRRHATVLATKLFWNILKRQGTVLFLPYKFRIKASPFTLLEEAATMRFVACHTKIPVPNVHFAFKRKDVTYLVMEKIDGEMLANTWCTRSGESLAKVLAQLKKMVGELRSIPAPADGRVARATGGELYNIRLP